MISDIDILLAQYIEIHFDKEFGLAIKNKIKNRLAEKGYSLTQAIKEFDIFDKTLREFFGAGTDGLLQRLFNNICGIKEERGKIRSIIVKDKDFTRLLMETYGNEEKKKILIALAETSMTLSALINKTGLPKTTGYRLIGLLLQNGLLSKSDDFEKVEDTKKIQKIPKYKTTIPLMDMHIRKNEIEIELSFDESSIKNSRILASVKPQMMKRTH